MNIMDIIKQAGGIESMAGELGVDQLTAKSGVEALLPAVMGGFKKNAQSTGGIGGLIGMASQMGGGDLLNNVLSTGPTDTSKGNAILGQIFGSKEVSRTVAGNAAEKSGVDPSILKKMLPMISMMVAGHVAKTGGDAATPPPAGAGGLGGMLGGLLGGGGKSAAGLGGLASMLDFDGDGNPLDDIMGMASKFTRKG